MYKVSSEQQPVQLAVLPEVSPALGARPRCVHTDHPGAPVGTLQLFLGPGHTDKPSAFFNLENPTLSPPGFYIRNRSC